MPKGYRNLDAPWERIIRRCEFVESGCLVYRGSIDATTGYGRLCGTGQAHVVMYEACHGPVPRGNVVHHTCENRACCNPTHLRKMTHQEHARHHLDHNERPCVKCGANDWYIRPERDGRLTDRECRPCRLARQRARCTR